MKAITALSSAALLALSAGQAAAHAEVGLPEVSVSYADLDLGRAAARVVLERRVANAVDRVCPARPLPSELGKMKSYRTCRETAWAGARRQLATIYGGRLLAEAQVRVVGAGN